MNSQVEKRRNNRRDLLGCFFSGAVRMNMSPTQTICLDTFNTFLSSIRQLMTLHHPARHLIQLSDRIREPDILWLCLQSISIHQIAFRPTAVYELILAITADGVTSDDELLMTTRQRDETTITLLETTNVGKKLSQSHVRGSLSFSISLCVCVCVRWRI